MTFAQCLLQQVQLHPAMTPQDVVKMCFQAAFGAEHLLADKTQAARRLTQEFDQTAPRKGPLTEAIGPVFLRVDLAVWKFYKLPLHQLLRMFLDTAALPQPAQAASRFEAMLSETGTLAAQGRLPFHAAAWQAFLVSYQSGGGGALHHSPAYRKQEQPAYRVVRRDVFFRTMRQE